MNSLLRKVALWCLRRLTRNHPDRVVHALGAVQFEISIARSLPRWKKQFASLEGRKDLQLNIGCGPKSKTGWVNIDLGPQAEYRYDLRLGLPLASASCRTVYNEHFFEHLNYKDGFHFLAECARVLRAGGLFRIVIPDCRSIFRAYLERDTGFFKPLEGLQLIDCQDAADITLVDQVNYAVYQNGEHLCIWDEEKLRHSLQKLGFSRMETSAFQPDLDSPDLIRRQYSFYFQAWK